MICPTCGHATEDTAAEPKGERIKDFIKRVGICHNTLNRRLKHKRCPKVEVNRGATGRLTAIYSNPLVDRFMKDGI